VAPPAANGSPQGGTYSTPPTYAAGA
jgi:hypothetical protein